MGTRSLALAACIVAAPLASAQHHGHGAHVASARALEQVREVAKLAERWGSEDSARAAGFVPALGWFPFMGTHWVHRVGVLMGKSTSHLEPSQLMFSRINGRETLVGAAYAYFAPLADSTRPAIFDGAPPWHGHDDLRMAGTSLVMLHVWFVDSPDGPFAGMNPLLPYWAMGLTPPPAEMMQDSAANVRVRKAALAIAELADTSGVLRLVRVTEETRAVLVERRARVRELIPEIERAASANDRAHWSALLDRAAAEWDVMREAYVRSVADPATNAALRRRIEQIETASP